MQLAFSTMGEKNSWYVKFTTQHQNSAVLNDINDISSDAMALIRQYC